MIVKTLTKKSLLILSAALIALSFHPLGLHFLAWFGLVPLFFVIDGAGPGKVFRTGLGFGFLVALFSLFWLVFLQIEISIKILILFGLVLMFLYLGLYYGVGLLIGRRLGLWSLALIIPGLEFIRSLGELGFPWLTLGYTQARYPLIIQQASLYGVYGISSWLILVNLAIFYLVKHRTIKFLPVLVLIVIVPLGYGAARLRNHPRGDLVIGIVQPNIDPNLKFTREMRDETFDRLIRLSERCADQALNKLDRPCELLVWPETAIPIEFKRPSHYQDKIFDLVDRIKAPVLTGNPLFDHRTREVYNGAILIEPGHKIVQEYRKIHLVPFGEHIPFDRYIPLLRRIDLGEGDYNPGREFTIFRTGKVSFGCLVCFESIFTDLARTFVQRGAGLLLNITNDGWFGKISGAQQHNDMAILRTVENGVSLARSSNTGISMVVDQYGRVLRQTELFEEDIIVLAIPVNPVNTRYRQIGDLAPIISIIIVTAWLAVHWLRPASRSD